MKKIVFKGCGTAIATPFNEKGINFTEFKKLIEFQVSNNTDSIIICGTTGESSTMTSDEKISLIKYTIKIVEKRIPIIVGTGSNDTNETIKMSKIAQELGVDGLLIVTPYYNKATQEGLIKHYKLISENVNIPIILYNVPGRTGVNILPNTCLELSKFKNIVAIKEASGDISQVAEIAHLCGDNLNIYSGNDNQIVPVLSLGGIGVISVLANIKPKVTHDIVQNFFDGNFNKAKQLQLENIPLINALFSEVNPIPVKEALNILGFDFGLPRMPLTQLSSENKCKLEKYLKS